MLVRLKFISCKRTHDKFIQLINLRAEIFCSQYGQSMLCWMSAFAIAAIGSKGVLVCFSHNSIRSSETSEALI